MSCKCRGCLAPASTLLCRSGPGRGGAVTSKDKCFGASRSIWQTFTGMEQVADAHIDSSMLLVGDVHMLVWLVSCC